MSETLSEAPFPSALIDLSSLARKLWARRLLIICIFILSVGGAAGYLAVTKPIYTATAVVLIDPRKPQTTNTDNVLPGIGSDSAAIASQVAVISSRDLLDTVFEAERIEQDPEFNTPDLFTRAPLTRDAIFDRFAQNVWIEREGLTYVINVSFKSHDALKSALIANAIVNTYVAQQIEEKASANSKVTGLLQPRIVELQEDLADAERAVEAFRIGYSIYPSVAGSTALQQKLFQLEAQLAAAKEELRQADTRAQRAISAGNSSQALLTLGEVLNSPTAESLRNEYTQRSMELASAQASMGPKHPTLAKLQSQLARVEDLMIKEARRITEELVSARDIAATVVASLESEIETLQAQANATNLQQVELRQLERNAEASRLVLEEFQRRSAETSQFESLQFSDARLITKATAPLRPTWPKPILVLLVASVAGLAAACSVALLLPPTAAKVRRQPARSPRQAAPTRRVATVERLPASDALSVERKRRLPELN